MSNNKKKNFFKSISMRKLFWNDRLLVGFSVVAAIIFWASVCVLFAPETTNVIENVPIKINTENSVPSQCGLSVFGDENFTVDITVSGSRYVIGENLLSAEDFKVTALTSSVTSAGTHSLQIRVSKANEDANFNIDSISENFINVYFDAWDKKEIPVTVKLNKDDFVKTGYISDSNYIMDSKTVIVSGPALEIAKLDSVVADVQISGDQLSETTTYTAGLTAYSKNLTALKYVKINDEEKAVMDVTVPVYRMGNQTLDVEFTNAPSSYSNNIDSLFDYEFTPSSLNIAVLQNGTQNDKLNVGTIDFSEIKSGKNKFKFDLSVVKNVKADSTNVKEIEVSFDLKDVESKTINLPVDKISVENPPEKGTLNFYVSYVSVTVYGKEKELEKLDADSLTAKIDFSSNESTEQGIYKGPVYLKNSDGCWVYGTYELGYTISK